MIRIVLHRGPFSVGYLSSRADGGLLRAGFELLWRTLVAACGRTDSAREWSHGTPVRWTANELRRRLIASGTERG